MAYGFGTDDDTATRFGTVAFYASLGRAFVTMCAVIPVLFLVEVIDIGAGGYLDVAGGIIPHRLDGLDGVLFSPFLHAGWDHLYGNAVPLILVGTFALAGGVKRFLYSTALIMAVSGLGVWFIGSPNSVVIGASGVIFGYLGFLMLSGWYARSFGSILLSVIVTLVWGSLILGMMPGEPGISWQAHIGGFLGGVLAARTFRVRPPQTAVTPT